MSKVQRLFPSSKHLPTTQSKPTKMSWTNTHPCGTRCKTKIVARLQFEFSTQRCFGSGTSSGALCTKRIWKNCRNTSEFSKTKCGNLKTKLNTFSSTKQSRCDSNKRKAVLAKTTYSSNRRSRIKSNYRKLSNTSWRRWKGKLKLESRLKK